MARPHNLSRPLTPPKRSGGSPVCSSRPTPRVFPSLGTIDVAMGLRRRAVTEWWLGLTADEQDLAAAFLERFVHYLDLTRAKVRSGHRTWADGGHSPGSDRPKGWSCRRCRGTPPEGVVITSAAGRGSGVVDERGSAGRGCEYALNGRRVPAAATVGRRHAAAVELVGDGGQRAAVGAQLGDAGHHVVG